MNYRSWGGRASRGLSNSGLALISACVLLPALTSALNAQDVTPLEGIVIYSANRTPTETAKVGSSVEVITEKELEGRSQTYVKDYLETLPGVHFTQNGPPGSTAGIQLRGASSYYVKVLVDGIDISDPSGPQTAAAFEHLLVGDVSRIEVLKGPQSTLYGSDAVAGVISIETKRARTLGFSQSGGAEYGAYNTWRGAYTAGYLASSGSNISLTIQGVSTDGFSAFSGGTEDDGYKNLTFSGRGEYFVTPTFKLFFAARSMRAEGDYDDWGADAANRFKGKQSAGRVGAEFATFGGALTHTIAIQGTTIERDYYASWPGSYDSDRVKGEYQGVFRFNESLSLLVGADWEWTSANSSEFIRREKADIGGAFAQLVVEPIEGLVLTAGGRFDEHSTFGDFSTHRFTGVYIIPGTDTKLRASYGTGFRAPSLYELYHPFFGNLDLLPEESEGWDVGIEQRFYGGRLVLGATYFELDTLNLIQWDGGGYNQILGISERHGVELTAALQVTPGITVTSSYTYTEAEGPMGLRLVRVPKHSYVVGLDAQLTKQIHANVTARYVSNVIDAGNRLDDYLLVNAKLSYEFSPGWKAYIRGENLLDEKYETVATYGTAGLSIYGGVQFALPNN